MKYDKKKHQKQIEEFRSKSNIEDIKRYQENAQEYLEEQSINSINAKYINQCVIKPFLKNNDEKSKAYKKSASLYAGASGILLLGSIGNPLFAHALLGVDVGSIIVDVVSCYSLALSAGFGVLSFLDVKELLKCKKEKNKLETEWNELSGTPEYVKRFMDKNNIAVTGMVGSGYSDLIVVKHFDDKVAPVLDEEWLY